MTSRTGSEPQPDPDRALKSRHRAMWASGDYPAIATTVIAELGIRLVEACGVGRADRVLDVAAGSGNAAIPAALAGAGVVASDLTPELFPAGRQAADAAGVAIDWVEADAESLPFADDEFDIVLSCVGVMFAPHHQASADELVRVCRPGGTIGLVNWTPDGFIGQMFTTMRPFAPSPPPGAQPPPLWGEKGHVAMLLGDRVTDMTAHRNTLAVECFPTPEAFLDYFKTRYGPTIGVYASLADRPGEAAELDRRLCALAQRHQLTSGDSQRPGAMGWDYLLLTARKSPAGRD